jgi:peptidoglycan hydrolase-like protein with peptidoglycan-binding domain
MYAYGTFDGIFGPQTVSATHTWQQSVAGPNPSTGAAGADTLALTQYATDQGGYYRLAQRTLNPDLWGYYGGSAYETQLWWEGGSTDVWWYKNPCHATHWGIADTAYNLIPSCAA